MGDSAKTGSEELGEMLRRARQRLGMSRRDLAESTGLSYPYISQLETGYRMPSSPAMRSLADALGLRVDSLFDAIPPSGPRDVAPTQSPAPDPVRERASGIALARAAAPTARAARPAAQLAGPAAPPEGSAAGAALGDHAGTASDSVAPAAAADSVAAGGGWIRNQRYASSVARSAYRTESDPAVDPLSTTMPAAMSGHDRVIDEATALLNSVPAGDRLAALGDVQARVVRSVVQDRIREGGGPD
jgi:transcriptional regulator with XRE-family HTH domain